MSEYDHFRSPRFRPCRPRELLTGSMVFAAALCLACVAFNLAVTLPFWRPYLGEESDKLARWRQLAGDVDIAFLGSSRVEFAVDPTVFDAAMAQLGRPSFSFNISVLDIRAPERAAVLDGMASVPTPKLRYVFVEPALNFTPSLANRMLTRMRYHYNWDMLLPALATKLDAHRSLLVRLGSASEIVLEVLINNANLGVLSDLFMPTLPGGDALEGAGRVKRGYAGDTHSAKTLSSDAFRAAWQASGGRRTFDAAGLNAPPRDLTGSEVAALRRLFEQVRRLGASPVALIPPQESDLDQVRAVREGIRRYFPGVPVLDYSYDRVPDPLYADPGLWMDEGHLSRAGSLVFSRRLAADWVALGQGRAGR